MNWFKKKHHLVVGDCKNINLEGLCNRGNFDIHVNGSIGNSFQNLHNQSRSQNANIAVVEETNASSIKGTLYSAPENPFDSIRGKAHIDYMSNTYALVKSY